MKKLLLFAAVAVFGFIMNAQEVRFGAKAGLNLASLSGDDTDDLDGITSFHVGGVAEIMFSDKFSFQPELLYSAQGAKYEESESEAGFTYNYEEKLKLGYINVPLMAKYYVAEGFSIEAGPQVGFLISAKAEWEETLTGEGVNETDSGDEDIKDFVKGIDFGVNLGFGYRMESGLNFAARYNLGLSNINDGEGSDDYSQQNNVIQFSVGYFFN
jgi:hypothetical protein